MRSSSDLPEPVAPMSSPCGPMPPWADSLMSSTTGAPSASLPIGTRSRSRGARGRHRSRTLTARASAMPSRLVSVVVAARKSPAAAPDDNGRSGASCLASASAATRDMASGTPSATSPR